MIILVLYYDTVHVCSECHNQLITVHVFTLYTAYAVGVAPA